MHKYENTAVTTMSCFGLNYGTRTLLVCIWSFFLVSIFGVEAAPLTLSDTNNNTIDTAEELDGILKGYLGTERQLRHDGLVRWFMEYPPASSRTTNPANGSVPVLILLHFGTGNMRSSRIFGRTVEKDPWLNLAKQHGYLVLSPSAVASHRWRDGYNTKPYKGDWNDLLGGANNNVVEIDDVGYISALVEWAIQKRRGDRRKVYIFGFSNGGTMVQRMIIERPNMFAAATAAVANLPAADVPLPSRGTPFFLMCGTKDNRMPYVGGVAADGRGVLRSAEATRDYFVAANHAGPNMIETMLPDTDPNDNCRIISQFYPSNTTPVQYYIMDGGGHNFAGKKSTIGGQPLPNALVYALDVLLGNPCYDANGIQLAWDFMTKFTLQ